MSELFIGTSGWNYPHWRDDFYAGVKRSDWLAHYAKQFNAVEVNATFYRLQSAGTLQRWRDETPAGFRFAIKGNRYLTHSKKLTDPTESVALERGNARPLGDKLAAVLWQLPGNLHKDIGRLRGFCESLRDWDGVRHAIEFRDRSWFDEETAACLRAFGIANCQSDAADWALWTAVTTNLVYARLHGHTRTYASAYRRAALDGWAASIRRWRRAGRSVHVYFDNDGEGAAPRDALRLMKLLA
ncbi:MAG: DUF72 domain-containing protein [Arenicellales bacterium]